VKVLELHLEGHPPVWMYEEDYATKSGALMPTPNHAMETFGFGPSYAHVFPDGNVRRFGERIGSFDDLKVVEP
jgi:hypothetical protein